MEVIKIDRARLKLMLSAADLEKYELDCDALEANDAAACLALGVLLRDAKRKVGSTADFNRISVRIFPCLKGGCELFVTAIEAGEENDASVKAAVVRRLITYKFGTLDALLGFCECIRRGGYAGKSTAYYDEKKRKYYLCCEAENIAAGEFGTKLSGNKEAFLREHCKLIADNAIEVLSALA